MLMGPDCAGKGRWPLLLLEFRDAQKTPPWKARQAKQDNVCLGPEEHDMFFEAWKISVGSA